MHTEIPKEWVTKILILFLVSFNFQISYAQSVKGNVTDYETGDPIPFANVFFSGTLIGSTTDIDGNFSLSIPIEGRYELVISFVGYRSFSRFINSADSLPFLNVELHPKVIQLQDIQIEADASEWKNNYPVFKRLFIGETQNASNVKIKNPKDIFLFYDPIENGLFAHSRKEIIIENNALGYRIGYTMQNFRMFFKTGRFMSFGIPRFEEMSATSKRQTKKWEKERVKAYEGSFNHFLRSFSENTFSQEGFIVQEVYRIPNPNRPTDSLIKEKLSAFRVSVSQSSSIIIGGSSDSDSLRYWMRMRNMPVLVDSLGRVLDDNSLIQGSIINYKGYLKIIFTGEKEEPSYARFRPGEVIDNKQTSIVYFPDFLTLYDNGYYDVEKVFFEGYMGWESRMAEMLPLEFVPLTK